MLSIAQLASVHLLLDEWADKVIKDGTARAVHVYGTIIDGVGFVPGKSDVDLLIELDEGELPVDRIKRLKSLAKSIGALSEQAAAAMGITEHVERVIGVTTATKFELEHGIHPARNSRDAFELQMYVSLPRERKGDWTGEVPRIIVGRRLSLTLLDVCFPAWSIVTSYQRLRDQVVHDPALLSSPISKDRAAEFPTKALARAAVDLRTLDEPETPTTYNAYEALSNGAAVLRQLILADEFNLHKPLSPLTLPAERGQVEYLYEHELLAFDMIARKAIERVEDLLGKRTTSAMRLASRKLFGELMRANGTTMRSVDNAIEIARVGTSIQDGRLHCHLSPATHDDVRHQFTDFDFENLVRLSEQWPDDIKEILLKAAELDKAAGMSTDSFAKVAVTAVDSSTAALNEGKLAVTIQPLSYWVVAHLNFATARQPFRNDLSAVRMRHLRELLQSGAQDHRWRWPSQLFVEPVIVLSDGTVPVIQKRDSPMAKALGTPIKTCGPEVGLSWTKDVTTIDDSNAFIDVEAAARRAVKKELGALDIVSIDFRSIIIQQAHLNAAITARIEVAQDRWDFGRIFSEHVRTRAAAGDTTFAENAEIIECSKITEMVTDQASTKGWHQSALIRLMEAPSKG